MARKGNSNRRSGRAKTFKPKAVPPSPPSPPPSAPRKAVKRTGLPPNSARSRAQRWDQSTQQTGRRGVWDDILAPTQEQRSERDEQIASRPEVLHVDGMEWWALEMGGQGNDVFLFHSQPAPSSTPPRPRTLAAGYSE